MSADHRAVSISRTNDLASASDVWRVPPWPPVAQCHLSVTPENLGSVTRRAGVADGAAVASPNLGADRRRLPSSL
jgi:hypothetical protein